MARKSPKHPPADTEAEPQDATEKGNGQEGHGRITKSEAVRRAIAAGAEQPSEGVPYIRDNFGLEIGAQHFSAVKAAEKKKVDSKSRPGRRPRIQPEGHPAPSIPANGDGDLLAAIEAIKPLVASLGADKVKRLVDVLA